MTNPVPHSCSLARRMARLLGQAVRAFIADDVSRLGAALAFYTTIAVAPLLVFAIAVAGAFFTEADARSRVLGEIERLAGPQASAAIKDFSRETKENTGRLATIISSATLALGAFGVFHQIQDALNTIWRVPPGPALGWIASLKRRLFSLAMVLSTGFLLIVSLIVSAGFAWLGNYAGGKLGLTEAVLQGVNAILSWVILTLSFATIFKLLPDLRIAWKHVWLGAAVTAVFFTAGKAVLGIYLSRPEVTSAYGAAASLVALLIWCYYSAQIFLFGAEFTQVSASSNGGRRTAKADGESSR
ncbi:MAG: YihY/virulence factor BrkB family protein [Opitutaceae bacterium]